MKITDFVALQRTMKMLRMTAASLRYMSETARGDYAEAHLDAAREHVIRARRLLAADHAPSTWSLMHDNPKEIEIPESPIHCDMCGCSEDDACPGGCSWALPGICSECAHAIGLPPRQDTPGDASVDNLVRSAAADLIWLANAEPVEIVVPPMRLYMVFAALQLVGRHPEATEMQLWAHARYFAERAQMMLGKDRPALAALLEAGWHRDHDGKLDIERGEIEP